VRRVVRRHHREIEIGFGPDVSPEGRRLTFRDRAEASAFLRRTFDPHELAWLRTLLARMATFPALSTESDAVRMAAERLVRGDLRVYERPAKMGEPRFAEGEDAETPSAKGEEASYFFHAVDGRGEASRIGSSVEAEFEEEEIGSSIETEVEEEEIGSSIEAELEPQGIESSIEADLGLEDEGGEAEAGEREYDGDGGSGPGDEGSGPARRNKAGKTQIEIVMIGDDGRPVPNVRYAVKLPDGALREGTLDAAGRARIDDVDPGECSVSFPDLDGAAWEAV
jgi:hypothetical protein